ncbi:MAG: Gfo/Idh/MocA family oxidoreductase [Sedimentisphaerales bacterium]|nr:Gfo/Idh/MocA family oxidoreductase [Sedimentisphaerales bacterium]
MGNEYNRRDFLKLGTKVGAGLTLGTIPLTSCTRQVTYEPIAAKAKPIMPLRVGFVGVGGRGTHLLKLFLEFEGIEVKAVCDIVKEKVGRAQRLTEKASQPKPAGYFRGETDFKRLCWNEQLDLVITATPWRWHVPVCVAAMETGKHAAAEVPVAVTMDECWQLVETAEKMGRYCIMLENCCYGYSEMMVLNMVRKGVLGELLHCEAGYMHDLRNIKLSYKGEGLWRTAHSVTRNGNLYPTHGLGPIAQCMNINRGDRFKYLVSMSSNSRGLSLYATEKFGPDHSLAKQKYALGDVNSSLIKTVNGLTIVLQHNCDSPRPYSRLKVVQGTKGIFEEGRPSRMGASDNDSIYIEGKSPQHQWELLMAYADEYEHPLWKALGKEARGKGHGGMDYLMVYRLVKALQDGTEPDMDVYDAASWSVVSELSERSTADKSRPVDFPDFTRGRWKTTKPLDIIGA